MSPYRILLVTNSNNTKQMALRPLSDAKKACNGDYVEGACLETVEEHWRSFFETRTFVVVFLTLLSKKKKTPQIL